MDVEETTIDHLGLDPQVMNKLNALRKGFWKLSNSSSQTTRFPSTLYILNVRSVVHITRVAPNIPHSGIRFEIRAAHPLGR